MFADAYEIVTRAGGSIQIVNRPGGGLLQTVCLPEAPEPADVADALAVALCTALGVVPAVRAGGTQASPVGTGLGVKLTSIILSGSAPSARSSRAAVLFLELIGALIAILLMFGEWLGRKWVHLN